MLFLLAAFAIGALAAPLIMRRGRLGFIILSVIPALAFAALAALGPRVLAGDFPQFAYHWVPQLNLSLTFRVDHLSWVMSLIVTGVGAVVLFYCARYFSPSAAGLGRFAGIFTGFAGAMLGLVTTDNTLALYLFWELTSVFSFILIGHSHEKRASRRAAMQAFIVTTAGGLAMLAGIIILGNIPGGSYSLTELIAAARGGTLGLAPIALESAPPALISTAVVLILLGALSKSAIIPFHFWLPAAMAAPTPTSAYLHAAAMVKAGVYLVARLAPAFAAYPAWRFLVIAGGLGTLMIGGVRALKQNDLKLVLAFGTVSQLGLILVMVGYGTPAMLLAGLGMLVAHAMFKATLFLAVGQVDWAAGTRDLRKLSGLGRQMPITATAAALAAASMMGIPGFAGFVAKEAALHALIGGDGLDTFAWVTIALGSAFTVAYSLRFWWGAFCSKGDLPATELKSLSWIMTAPIVLLSSGGLIFGFGGAMLDAVLSPYAAQLPGELGHLTSWPGLGLPFLITTLIVASGVGLFMIRDRFEAASQFPIAAEQTYQRLLGGLERLSGWTTGFTQRGSLPAYLSTIFVFAVLAASGAMLLGDTGVWPSLRVADSAAQLLVAVVTIVAAYYGARARHRMRAVLLIGVSGYGVAFTYELYGAPDLALTQVLVETMSLVVFVLVIRRLPAYFSNRPLRASRWWRVTVAAVTGTTVSVLALFAVAARQHEPISVKFHDETFLYGYGKNIVNVTLVDTRAWDTMGEISVVVACAIGISSLLFIRDRGARVDRFRNLAMPFMNVAGQVMRPTRDTGGPSWRRSRTRAIEAAVSSPGRNRRWLQGTDTLAASRRSVILEVGTRITFHSILVVSVFFLFSGHNQPGGGFAGGLVAGIALVLRYLAGGRYELGATIPLNPGHLMGSGLVVAGLAAMAPLAFGGTILQSVRVDLTLPGFGPVHLATAVFFDIGVYLVVVGMILDILRSLGAEIDRHGEIEGVEERDFEFSPSEDTRRSVSDARSARDYDASSDGVSSDDASGRGAETSEDDTSSFGQLDLTTGLTTVASDPATTSSTLSDSES